MSVLHDLFCKRCNTLEEDVWCEPPKRPRCPACGRPRTIAITKAFATDVYGVGRRYDNLGIDEARSTRDLERQMHRRGYTPCGDKYHGARSSVRGPKPPLAHDGRARRLGSLP